MTTNVILRRFSVAALFGLALTSWAGQALAESFLILPLIGDRITIVGQQQQTGSRIDQNKTTVVQIKEPGFDNAALIAADKAAAVEDVVIGRNGKPVVRIPALVPSKRRINFGVLKGKLTIPPNFDDSMPDDVFAHFAGR